MRGGKDMKKVLKWLKEGKDELLFGGITLLAGLLALSIVYNVIFIGISDDLVDRVEKEVKEKQVLQQERNYYYGLYDSIIQSYEDVIPKGQYIQEVEYLESVILQLRQACGEECEGI